MAMLEAFLHDPLLNWRLTEADGGQEGGEPAGGKPSKANDVAPSQPSGLTVEAAARVRRDNSGALTAVQSKHNHEPLSPPRSVSARSGGSQC